MGKIPVEEMPNTTTTQKETNRQAIQNINRSGTVSGRPSGVSNISGKIVKDTTSSSNLSGTNQRQNGSPRVSKTGSNPTGVNTKSYNLAGSNNIKASTGTFNTGAKTYNNAYTTNSTGSKVSVTTVADNQKKYQSDLSKMADSSIKKVQSIFQRAGDFYNDVKKDVDAKLAEDRKTPQKYTVSRMIEDKINETKQKNMAFDEDQRNQYVNSIREEDVPKMMGENGNLIDFQPVVKQLETQLAGYDQLLASEDLDEKQRLTVENERRKTATELEEKRDLFNKSRAWTEKYQLDYYEGRGDLDTANSLREQFSHKNDDMFQRFGNAAAHLITETANEIPTAIDQIKLSGQTNVANDYITELEALHDSGEISDDQYAEGLKYWGQALQDYKDDYFSSFSQRFQSQINQLSANTHYGASKIEDFMLQAGESTAQFVLHYAIGKATSSFVFGKNAVMQAGTDLAIEQYGAEAVKSMGKERLMNLGSRVLGGEIATTTMSLASSTSKFNQLLQEGYDVETAMQNAIFTGLVSYATEKVGMDRFVDMLGTDISVSILGEVLKKNVSSAISEGAEELVEGLIDPVVDFYTLGKDVEVNGSELWMAFLLGGTSGLAMSMAADVGSIYNSYKLNQALMNNQGVRQALVANTGKLLVGTRTQYNMLKNEVNKLDEYKPSMTPDQLNVAEELSNLGKQALSEYEAKSTTLGVEFPEDTVSTTTQQENDQTLVQTLESDFNQNVKMNEDVNQLLEKINNDIADLAAADVAAIESIQQSLYEHGYDIDANLFSQLSEAERNNALVAADFSKITGINARVTDYNGIREAMLASGFKGSAAELEDKVRNSNGFVNKNGEIFINALKRPVLYTLTHELTHGTESSKYYEPLKKIVQESTDWETNYKDRANAYKWAKKTMSEEEFKDYVEKETVARSVEELLGDEKFINDLVKYNYSLASRIWQDLNAMGSNDETDKIRNAFEKAFADNHQQNMDKLSSDIAQMDSEYMGAVKKGDMKAAQELVKQYAVSKGFSPEQFYHATASEGFTEFDKSKIKALETDADYNGFWVSSDPGTSPSFRDAKKTYPLYIKYGNVAPADVIKQVQKEVKKEWRNPDRKLHAEARSLQDEVRLRLEDLGYNSIVFDDKVDINVDELEKTGATEWESARGYKYRLEYDEERSKEVGEDAYLLYRWSNNQDAWMWTQEDYWGTPQQIADDINTYRHGEKVVVLFEPNQLKSSAPVEYDNDGNVIPLEKRFSDSNDIRYSYDADYLKAIENGDVEGVKKIIDKAAKESGYPIKVFHGTINDGFSVFDPYDKGFSWFTKNSGYAYEYTHPYDTDIIGNEGRAIYEGYLKDGNYLNIGNINEDIKDRNGNFSKEMQNVSSLVGMTPQELLDTIEKNRDYLDDDLVYDVTQTKTYADLVRNLGYDGVEAKEHGGVTTYGVLDSSAFKRAGWYRGEGLEDETLAMEDIVERDNKGNIIPLSERFNPENDDIRYSYDSEDQYGYHYGAENLDYNKKSETLWRRSGRGTGAFGTGTYFFGDGRFKSSYRTNPDNSEHKVDFSSYNLFKPNNSDDGFRLHDIFKGFDDNYFFEGAKSTTELKQRISDIIDSFDEIEENENFDKLLTPEEEDEIRQTLIELGDDEDYVDKLLDDNRYNSDYVDAELLADDLRDRYIDENNWRSRPNSLKRTERYETAINNVSELANILGEDEAHMRDIVNEAMRSAEIDSQKRDFIGANYDSVGTRIMKALGYEGIDVRHIPELDNSIYGSVIYDLNPDTVRYSYDQESDIINEETNDELKRIQDPNSTLSKEQLALLKSRDPAFIKEIRGRITTLFRDGVITDNSSYNDTKRVVKVNGDDFYEFFKANKNYLRDPETVDLLDKKDYQDGTAYMSDDGLSGFYITKDGDLKSVFNNSGKPYFLTDIKDVVTRNAKTLDCFQSDVNRLATMYSETFGFKVASILDFNKEVMEGDHGKKFTRDFIKKYGKAPVYFMVNTDQDVKTEHFNKDQWKEAYDYRNSFVNKVTDDLNVSEEEMKKYKMIKSVTERTKSIDKNIDKNTGVYKPQGIIELESTIGKTTHKEEIKDGEEYAEKVAQQLDDGADPEDILEQLKANPLNNGLIRAYYTSQVLADRGLKNEYKELAQWARDIDNLGGKLIDSTKILYDLNDTFSRAVYLTTVQDNLVDEYKLKYGNKDVDVDKIINEIFQKSFDAITHSETVREFRKAVGNLAREVNRVMPKTIWDRITQYRMIAMLSGTKTAVSNFISNVFTTGLYRMKDFNQAAIEAAVQQVTVKEFDDVKQYGIKQGDRQTTFKLDKEATKRNKAAAKEIFDQLEEASKTKYGDDVEKIPDIIKKRLKEAHSTTKKPIAKALDNLTELVQSVQQTMLDDTMFTKGAFVYKFNQLAQARGIDVRTVDRLSKEFNKLVDDAYDYAEEVVSHDATDISNTLSNLKKRSAKNVRVNQDSTLVGLDTAIKRFKERANEGQPIFKAIDAVVRRTEPLWMPFYKTNASVLKKALQYSPLEIVQVINDYSRVKANKMDLVDMVEHMAKFATGTELYILGAIFSRLGWLKWDKDDEDHTGRLIVKIPGTDYGITADFIDPVSTIFAKGVVLNQELMEEGVSFKFLADLVNDYEVIFLADELDMFSTMKDFFETVGKVRKGKDDYGDYTLADGAANVSFTILNSYIPAIVRDISRIIDPAKKVTYTSDQKKYLLNRLLNSTPFRTKLVDKKDATGNTLTYTQPYTKNDLANRIITQMLSRGKLVDMKGKAITTTQQNPENKLGENASEFTKMAQDFQFKDDNGDGYSDQHWIRDTVPTNIYPGNEKVELTPEEKDAYGKTWTDTWTTGANSLLNNDAYKNLSYENQADVVYELQAFSRRVIEAEYCQKNKKDMTDSQKAALKLKEFCTKNGKLNGDLLSLIALGTAKENKLSNGGQQYVLGKKGEDGKTIRNSRQLYMRQLYEEAGVYDDILKAVESGKFKYADFGLSKTVVKQPEGKSKANYQDIYNKTMNKSNRSKTSGKKAKNVSSSLKGGGSAAKIRMNKATPIKSADTNFKKAYQNVFSRQGSKNVSSGSSGGGACPNCGARVSAGASRCPNCGTKL